MRFFSKNDTTTRFSLPLTNLAFLVFLSLALTALMVLYLDQLPSQIKPGTPATKDVIAGKRYEWIDEEATWRAKEEAAKMVLPVFDFNAALSEDRSAQIAKSMSEARSKWQAASGALTLDEEHVLRENFQIELGVVLKDSQYAQIRDNGFSEELEKALIALLAPLEKRWIIEDKSVLFAYNNKAATLRSLSVDGTEQSAETLTSLTDFLSREEARQYYMAQKPVDLQKRFYLDFIDIKNVKIALDVLPEFVKPNVIFNREATEILKSRARDAVSPIKNVREKGEIIIRHGEKFEDWHIRVIEGIRKARLESNMILKFFGLFLVVLASIATVIYFADRELLKFKPARKDYYFLGCMLVGFLCMLRLSTFVATNIYDGLSFTSEINTLYYFFPVAAGAMIVRYILNAGTAFVFAVLLSVFSGLFLDNNIEMAVYYLVGSVFAAHLVGEADRRSTVFRHGIYIGLMQATLAIGYFLLNKSGSSGAFEIKPMLINALFAFLGGIACSLALLALSPLVETVFAYTTNFQLMELANMNHPLMREMIVRAPGTYHHSQLVGILSEAAARAISANPLLAKVGSYYHDIGKMKKPQYFVENQKGYNPHDTLSPSMSALIIEAHVKDGLEMAREYKLPQIIADFIPQHQSTKLIGYFYQKAKKLAEETGGAPVDEKDYRYPGPKPQSREAGIVMLADTIEAAVRSMPDKAPQKIEAQVKKLVDYHFTDGQLDDCQLTLKDLNLIVDAFVKILLGIYHQRVEYPDAQAAKKPQPHNKPATSSVAASSAQRTPSVASVSPLFKDKN